MTACMLCVSFGNGGTILILWIFPHKGVVSVVAYVWYLVSVALSCCSRCSDSSAPPHDDCSSRCSTMLRARTTYLVYTPRTFLRMVPHNNCMVLVWVNVLMVSYEVLSTAVPGVEYLLQLKILLRLIAILSSVAVKATLPRRYDSTLYITATVPPVRSRKL